jgi:predicted ester cyclase
MQLFSYPTKSIYQFLMLLLPILLLFSTAHAQTETELETVNRNNMQRFVDEVYNNGNINIIDILFAEDSLGYPGERNRDNYAASVIGLRAAMPDLYATPTVIIVENDWAAMQILLQGTFVDEMVFPDSPPIPPTGKQIQFVVNIALQTNPQGRVLQYWVGFDNLSFLAQIDLIPRPQTLWQGNTEYVPIIQTGQEENNKLTTLQYYDAWFREDYASMKQRLSNEFVGYNPFGSFERDGQVTDLRLFRTAFPDFTWEMKAMIAEGNYVVMVHNISGTFTNDFVLSEGLRITPTNQALNLSRIDFLRFDEQNMIVETWELYDVWDFLGQLQVPLFQDNP